MTCNAHNIYINCIQPEKKTQKKNNGMDWIYSYHPLCMQPTKEEDRIYFKQEADVKYRAGEKTLTSGNTEEMADWYKWNTMKQ